MHAREYTYILKTEQNNLLPQPLPSTYFLNTARSQMAQRIPEFSIETCSVIAIPIIYMAFKVITSFRAPAYIMFLAPMLRMPRRSLRIVLKAFPDR